MGVGVRGEQSRGFPGECDMMAEGLKGTSLVRCGAHYPPWDVHSLSALQLQHGFLSVIEIQAQGREQTGKGGVWGSLKQGK